MYVDEGRLLYATWELAGMDQQVFDAEIELYGKELVEIIAKMEKTSQRFVAVTIACLKQWYQDRAKSYVQEHFDLTNKLGLENISQMKARVTQLVMMVPNAAKALLLDQNLWWHQSRGGGWQDHYTQGPPDGLHMAICALAERLTPILETYGYVKKEPCPERDEEDNDTQPREPIKRKGGGPPQLEWTEEMTKCISEYKEDLGRATFLDSKMEQARKRKAKHNAGLLWEKA
jgi:hypothetical protein